MRAGLALGSNLGDRLALLRAAWQEVRRLPGAKGPWLTSRIYETEPVDCAPGEQAYLNAVAEVEWSGTPEALLAALMGIEQALGRPAEREGNAARTIDLDVLYLDDLMREEDAPLLPHPRLHQRRFVLAPLAEFRPHWVVPGVDQSVIALLRDLPPAGAVEVFPHALAPMPAWTDALRAQKQRREPVAVLTAYDYPTARLLEEAGVELLLVGDSLGMVVLGYPDTTHVTMADMLHHLRAVRRGAAHSRILADLPALSYETVEDALANAQALIAAGADAVKLEGGRSHVAQIAALVNAGIPVMAHLGMLPQSVKVEGGYRIKGKTPEGAEQLLADALAVQAAGAFAVVLELVQVDTARRLSETLEIPTIGIGAGTGCDGQVLVTHDLVGLFPWFTPKFVRSEAAVGAAIREAARAFVQRTKARE